MPIYLDHAHNSLPKPKEVGQAMAAALNAPLDGTLIEKAARKAEEFFHSPGSYLFTANRTQSLKIILEQILPPDGQLLYIGLWTDGLGKLLEGNIAIPLDRKGQIDLPQVEGQISPQTKLILTHFACPLTGTILPWKEIQALAHKYEIPMVLDISTAVGLLPLELNDCDLAIFPGHTGLLCPPGIAGLYISPRLLESHPWPTQEELGTPNLPGIAGLMAAMKLLMKKDLSQLQKIWQGYLKDLLDFIAQYPGVAIYGPGDPLGQVPILAFNIQDLPAKEVAAVIDEVYDIQLAGSITLPEAMASSLGCPPTGLLRASFSYQTRPEEIAYFSRAIKEISIPV
ncbi:MAG: aminotransferase class V-fold PLP-dependent enzyme [Limnochordia bacterium]